MYSFQTRFDELKAEAALPSPTGIAVEILRLSRSQESSVAELAKLIQADPALTGRLIKLANAGETGTERPFASVSEAIRWLGLRTVRSTSLAFSLVASPTARLCHAFDYDRFWSLSFATAVWCRELAARLHVAPSEEAFACGLLFQIGELTLATVYPPEYDKMLVGLSMGSGRTERWEQESECFGITSNELSAAMLNDWGFPRVFVDAILETAIPCHEPLRTLPRHKQFAAILKSAQALAEFVTDDQQGSELESPLAQAVIDYLGVDREVVPKVFAEARQAWDDWSRHFLESKSEEGIMPVLSETAAKALAAPVEVVDDRPTDDLLILVAEDNAPQRHFLSHMLRAAGHRVISAEDGKRAQRLALDNRPHIIIADWQMPEMDGLELCDALRSTKVGRAMYFILITGADDDDLVQRAFDHGVDDFITKPFRPREFQSRMKAALRLRNVEDEMRRERAELRQLAGELSIANRKLEAAMLTDFLTDLPNRRFLMQHLEQQWSAARRNHRPLACLVIDVDHFKQVNDRHGHGVGDAVLQTLAAVLRSHQRKEDVVCRYGGEEFVVVLPDADEETALDTAERLRLVTEQEVASRLILPQPITISIGLGSLSSRTTTIDELLGAADQALYEAKRAGRNCIRTATAVEAFSE